jgi:hypothetical protein
MAPEVSNVSHITEDVRKSESNTLQTPEITAETDYDIAHTDTKTILDGCICY